MKRIFGIEINRNILANVREMRDLSKCYSKSSQESYSCIANSRKNVASATSRGICWLHASTTAGERQLCKTTNHGRNPEKRKRSNIAKSGIA